jgi:hypothetical protein
MITIGFKQFIATRPRETDVPEHPRGRMGLSDFTEMGVFGVRIAVAVRASAHHFRPAFSGFVHAHVVLAVRASWRWRGDADSGDDRPDSARAAGLPAGRDFVKGKAIRPRNNPKPSHCLFFHPVDACA